MGSKLISKIFSVVIWIVALFGINGTFGLVREEFTSEDICPKIVGIPACNIILTCLILIVISQSNLLKDKNRLFFIGAGVAATIALVGTIGQLMGWLECPKTEGGIPMCFLSWGLFASLLLLKFIEIKSTSHKSF